MGTGTVACHESEMIRGTSTQATHVGTNARGYVPILSVDWCGESVGDRRSILKIHIRAASIWIGRTVEGS